MSFLPIVEFGCRRDVPGRRTGANITSGIYKKLALAIGQCMLLNVQKIYAKENSNCSFFSLMHGIIERLFVDDTVSRLFGCHFPSIKIQKYTRKCCQKCAVSALPKEYILLKVAIWKQHKMFVNFVPQNQVYTLDYAFRSIILRLTSICI